MTPSTQQFILSGQTITSDNNNGLTINGINLTGVLTGSFIANNQTGNFYPSSNPSGFISSVNSLVYSIALG